MWAGSHLPTITLNIRMSEYDLIIEALVNGAPEKEVTDVLTEGKFDDNLRDTQNLYVLLFEQYVDECSCYAFKGWENLKIRGRPVIEKYWVEIELVAPQEFDYEGGVSRLLGKNKENRSKITKTSDGTPILKVRILRSLLDQLEEENQRIARREAEDQGYAPKSDDEPENNEQEDPFMNNFDNEFGNEPGGGPF